MLFPAPGSKSQSLPQSAGSTNEDKVAQALLEVPPDVTLFVTPTSADTARVALAYRKRVPHAQVKKEIGKLASNGWVIGNDMGVEDASIRPGDPARAPITTSAHFSLTKAPQVQNNAPLLLPYLQAFQEWPHVAIIFDLSDLSPYNGVDAFDNQALSIRRVPEQNAYHYEALIRDHQGTLPALPAGAPKSIATTATHEPSPSPKSMQAPLLPMMLILLGLGLLGGLGLYSWLARRASSAVPTRNARL